MVIRKSPLPPLRKGGGGGISVSGIGMKTLLNVKVQPRSSAPGVERTGERDLKVRVKAAPDKGRANAEIVARLAAHLGVPPSRLTLVRGASSSQKLIRLEP